MSTTQTRDPRLDPQKGDIISRGNRASDVVRTRVVTGRDGNDIFYEDHKGHKCKCWISSWQEWARLADVAGAEKEPVLAAKQLIIDRATRAADALVLASGAMDRYDGITVKELEAVFRAEHVSETDVIRAFRTGLRRLVGRLQ